MIFDFLRPNDRLKIRNRTQGVNAFQGLFWTILENHPPHANLWWFWGKTKPDPDFHGFFEEFREGEPRGVHGRTGGSGKP